MGRDDIPRDKGLAIAGNRPMLAWVIERLAGQLDELLISVNHNAGEYARFGLPLIGDEIGHYSGPLAGLHAAMRAARHPWVLSVPCDVPLLPRTLVQRMTQVFATEPAPLAVARADRREQSAFLLAHSSLAGGIADFLARGGRSIRGWYAAIPHVLVDFDEPAAFRNINTEDELREFNAKLD